MLNFELFICLEASFQSSYPNFAGLLISIVEQVFKYVHKLEFLPEIKVHPRSMSHH